MKRPKHAPASRMSQVALLALMMLIVMVGCAPAIASFDPVTPQGLAITNLFALLLVLSFLLLLFVVGLLGYMLVRFRGRPGDADPEQRAGNRRLEIAWTAAPALLLTVIFVISLKTMHDVQAPSSAPLHLTVIGHQWWWEVQYPDLGITTANELHVPVGQPIQIDLQASDVLHSFWVPQFGWMTDTVPGKTNVMQVRVERAGVFDGACTQFCGLEHAWMRTRVVAQSSSEFDAWVQQQRQAAGQPTESLAVRGQQVFLGSTCVSCHTVQGTRATGQIGPNLTHVGSRSTLAGGVVENTADELRRWIRDPQSLKPGVLMPRYPFSDDDLSALVAYLEGLR